MVVGAVGRNLGEGAVVLAYIIGALDVVEAVDLVLAGKSGAFVKVTGNISGVVSAKKMFALVVVSKAFL